MFSLAFETSSLVGSIALGRADDLVACAEVSQHQRHNLDLMPAIDRLCREHHVGPGDVDEVYVSIGPGSFTGLRIAIATAKMLSLTRGVKLVAVPTLDVLVQNAPPDASPVAACLNLKRDTVWSAIYIWAGGRWTFAAEPALRTMAELLALRPTVLLGDPIPEAAGITILPKNLAIPHSDALWRLGRDAARRGGFVDAMALAPLYAREPEAVTLWEARKREKAKTP